MVFGDAALTTSSASVSLGIPISRLAGILGCRRPITIDTAMRLARYFGTSTRMWINLQSRYDLDLAERELADRIASEVQPYQKSA